MRAVRSETQAFSDLRATVKPVFDDLDSVPPPVAAVREWSALQSIARASQPLASLGAKLQAWAERWCLEPDRFEPLGARGALTAEWVLTVALRTLNTWSQSPSAADDMLVLGAVHVYPGYLDDDQRAINVATHSSWDPIHETRSKARKRIRDECLAEVDKHLDRIEAAATERGAQGARSASSVLARDLRWLASAHVAGMSVSAICDRDEVFVETVAQAVRRRSTDLGLVRPRIRTT